jgi:hypothetical protein
LGLLPLPATRLLGLLLTRIRLVTWGESFGRAPLPSRRDRAYVRRLSAGPSGARGLRWTGWGVSTACAWLACG